jgi:hypothetical protein
MTAQAEDAEAGHMATALEDMLANTGRAWQARSPRPWLVTQHL